MNLPSQVRPFKRKKPQPYLVRALILGGGDGGGSLSQKSVGISMAEGVKWGQLTTWSLEMPLRPMNREQAWLLPPSLDELLPKDHSARFVAEFVDGLDQTQWAEMGINLDGEVLGAPSYHARALLSVWLHGFMTGVRSSRKLESACRDQIPYLWLTGWQHPDHNTLWRFYRGHRLEMRTLLKFSVSTAVELGLVDLAVQAVDGTKIQGNASRQRTYDAAGLQKLLQRTDAAIAELEAQNEGGDDPPPPRLPEHLAQAQRLREQVRSAMGRLSSEEGIKHINLTDAAAQLMKGRQGFVAGYNAQAMVSPLAVNQAKGGSFLITAADVTDAPDDYGQLVPMMEQAEELTGERAELTLADGGYHSGENLAACDQRGRIILMPEGQTKAMRRPYFKDHFEHDAISDTYRCPQGQQLIFRGLRKHKAALMRTYRATGHICRACPAFGICTKDGRYGRALWIGPHDDLLRRHRQFMATEPAKVVYRRRKGLVEPVFGILKEQMSARRFLLRGLNNVRAEFTLLATAFNLRSLWRAWAVSRKPALLC